jgi:tetratricopeptide (TPR) repeat protein
VERLACEIISTQVAKTSSTTSIPQQGLNLLWQQLKSLAAQAASTTNLNPSDCLFVDSVVTAFAPAPVESEDALSSQLAAELAMVHAACKATSDGRMEDAVEAIRALPANSVFRHWKIFLRGMRHFLTGAKKEAEACFSRLPEGGACATAAAVILNKPHAAEIPAIGKTGWILATVGESPTKAREIATADECWKKGNWNGAKDALARALGRNFSIKLRGIEYALSEHLFSLGLEELPVEIKRSQQIESFFCQQRAIPQSASEILYSVWIVLVLIDAHSIPDSNLESEFGDILKMSSDFYGKNPIRDSVIYETLGDIFALDSNRGKSAVAARSLYKPRNAERAIKAFIQATRSAPDNESAWVKLLSVHEKLQNKSEVHQLLDQLVARFPQNKHILSKAGVLAVERKAFAKGIDYLEAAHQLDPLDSKCKTQLIAGLTDYIINRHKKKQSTASLWDRVAPLLDSSPDCRDLTQAKWAMDKLRDMLEERMDGNAECNSLFFEIYLCRRLQRPLRKNWHTQWNNTPVTGKNWGSLLQIVEVVTSRPDFPIWQLDDFQAALCNKLNPKDLENSIKENPRDIFSFAVVLLKWSEEEQAYDQVFVECCFDALNDSLRKLLKKKQIQRDIHIRFCLLLCDFILQCKSQSLMDTDLKKIDQEAQEKGLDYMRQAVASFRDQLREFSFLDHETDGDIDDCSPPKPRPRKKASPVEKMNTETKPMASPNDEAQMEFEL